MDKTGGDTMDVIEDPADELQEKIEAIARDVDRLVGSGFLGRGPSWMKAWYEFHLEWSKEPDEGLTIPSKFLTPFIELAKSDGEVFELAMFLVATRLEHGLAGPDQLSSLIVSFLKGEFLKPKKKRGRSPETGRDFIIVEIMRRLVDEDDLLASVNYCTEESTERESCASELLCEALELTEVWNMEKENIQRVWYSEKAQDSYIYIRGLQVTNQFDDVDDEL